MHRYKSGKLTNVMIWMKLFPQVYSTFTNHQPGRIISLKIPENTREVAASLKQSYLHRAHISHYMNFTIMKRLWASVRGPKLWAVDAHSHISFSCWCCCPSRHLRSRLPRGCPPWWCRTNPLLGCLDSGTFAPWSHCWCAVRWGSPPVAYRSSSCWPDAHTLYQERKALWRTETKRQMYNIFKMLVKHLDTWFKTFKGLNITGFLKQTDW